MAESEQYKLFSDYILTFDTSSYLHLSTLKNKLRTLWTQSACVPINVCWVEQKFQVPNQSYVIKWIQQRRSQIHFFFLEEKFANCPRKKKKKLCLIQLYYMFHLVIKHLLCVFKMY